MDKNLNDYAYMKVGNYSNVYLRDNNKNSYTHEHGESNMRMIYDPIYKFISFPKLMWDFIDTPTYQRTRRLKQLAMSQWLYPGATHTRFEHCLGTGYLANDLIRKCLKDIKKTNHLDQEERLLIENVSLAGLCHDIAHGPFSHVFDMVLKHLNLEQIFNHEIFSKDLLCYLIDNSDFEFDKTRLNLISSLIIGKTINNSESWDYPWIYEIVANKKYSLDVDKFDYIRRDIYHLGLSCQSVNYDRIYSDFKLIDGTICFNEKHADDIFEVFNSRNDLHKKAYRHPKNLSVSLMITDALSLSDEYFNFSNIISHPEQFIKYDDTMMDIIRNFDDNENIDFYNSNKLLKAKQLIDDLDNRKLYKFIGQILVPCNYINFKPDINEFLECDNPKDDKYVVKDDIEILPEYFDFGNKDKNPLEKINFYNPFVSNPIPIHNSLNNYGYFPKVFRELIIFVYCKNLNKVDRVIQLFDNYKNKLYKQWNHNNYAYNFDSPVSQKSKGFLGNKRSIQDMRNYYTVYNPKD